MEKLLCVEGSHKAWIEARRIGRHHAPVKRGVTGHAIIGATSHVRYIDKTREYYQSEGYAKPYQQAHFDDVPFTLPGRPLAQCRVGDGTSRSAPPSDPSATRP